ncbi:MAG: PAS domain S-box protein [Breznakibacter sp.]
MADLLLLLLFWCVFAAILFNEFNLYHINLIHHYFLVWIVDLVIISLPFQIVVFKNFFAIQIESHKEEIAKLNEKIAKNIELASIIGRGGAETLSSIDDELSRTLINLGKNLAITKKKEEELNWIARGKEIVSDIMRSSTKLNEVAINVLKTIINYSDAVQGAIYLLEDKKLNNIASYAYNRQRFEKQTIPLGKGLIGEAAYEKELISRTEIPDSYFTMTSGLIGEQKPKSLLIIPLMQEEEVLGVMELAFFQSQLPQSTISLAEELSSVVGRSFYNLKINAQTEMLLLESQAMTNTLKENEAKLHENAKEMLIAKEELEKSNSLLAKQIQEVENAQKRLQALLTNASEFISIYNERQELVFESPSVRRILGYKDTDKVTGMDPDLLTPKGYKTINNLFQYLLETPGGEQVAQYTYLKKNGEKLFLETQGKNLLHDPAIKGIIFNTQDITERKRAEKEERMKSRMQSLSENSPDMILRISTTGKLVYTNPAISKFMSISQADITKKRINELDIDQRFIDFIRESLSIMREEPRQIVSEVEIESSNGLRIMEIKSIPEFTEDQELESVLFVAHDLTEMKLIEQEIKEKNKKISDSINYAQRIQSSILPDTDVIQQFFPRSFIFYRPKDVVSGDFPWFAEKDGYLYIAAVDCTGHGVPGALLSFIGYFLLNNIVSAEKDLSAAETLEHLHQLVRRTLRQDQQGANGRDGMDLALLKISKEKNVIEFAGAHRPLYYLREGELIEYKGSRKGIGGIPLANKTEPAFENNIIEYKQGDKLFIFSDGLPDQTGGFEGKKYMNKRIREVLVEDKEATMAHFARFFSRDFHEWMGDGKQVDDVLLIGIEM